MNEVKSSNLHSVGVHGKDLLVRFKGKDGKPAKTYRYKDGARHHKPMLASPSAGSYLHTVVKAKHDCTEEPCE